MKYGRVYNFSAGPAMIPEEVLEEVAAELLNYRGTGMSVMEMSHRSKAFQTIIDEAEADLRVLMGIPDNYKVLFIQGGATLQFSAIPMNLLKTGVADYIVTGAWSKKAYSEAKKYGKINLIATSEDRNYSYIPDMDKVSVSIFIIDYLLRWFTADLRHPDKPRAVAFLQYPVTPMAIIDLLSIIPSFFVINRALKLFRITRLMKILRVVRIIRYSEHVQILIRVLTKERKILLTVFLMAVAYIFITALIMFNIEDSELFANFFDALYWATTTLTTVGYGDIYPGSDIGRAISMLSAIFGVAIIALPSGVITAGYLDELRESKKKKN